MKLMDFKNGKELLELCNTYQLSISDVMKKREADFTDRSSKEILEKMKQIWQVMKKSAALPLISTTKSVGGLIGGEAMLLSQNTQNSSLLCGSVLHKAIMYSMAVLEVNASMGVIVAAPTAGSSGIVPGLLLAMQEEYGFSDDKIITALFNAGAIGYLAMRNATVAGAVGGCQAEVGIASSMAASACVELLQGSPAQCLNAASTVLMNCLGLVCDPVAGLVEYPCQLRNASGVSNALTAAAIALSSVPQLIPFDEMLSTMYSVGKRIPVELRETALGGCAVTPSACMAGGCCM